MFQFCFKVAFFDSIREVPGRIQSWLILFFFSFLCCLAYLIKTLQAIFFYSDLTVMALQLFLFSCHKRGRQTS